MLYIFFFFCISGFDIESLKVQDVLSVSKVLFSYTALKEVIHLYLYIALHAGALIWLKKPELANNF